MGDGQGLDVQKLDLTPFLDEVEPECQWRTLNKVRQHVGRLDKAGNELVHAMDRKGRSWKGLLSVLI